MKGKTKIMFFPVNSTSQFNRQNAKHFFQTVCCGNIECSVVASSVVVSYVRVSGMLPEAAASVHRIEKLPSRGSPSKRYNREDDKLETDNANQQKYGSARKHKPSLKNLWRSRGQSRSLCSPDCVDYALYSWSRILEFQKQSAKDYWGVGASLGQPVSLWWSTLIVNQRGSEII